MNIVKKIEAMAARLERAKEIVKDGLIYPIYGDEEQRFVCKSHTAQKDGNGQVKLYLVTDKACTCADFRRLKDQNGGWCKHRLAREILINKGGDHAENRVSHKSDGDPKPTQRRRALSTHGGDRRRTVRAGS
jgi:hypothetical protein